MNSYDEVISKMQYHLSKRGEGYSMPLTPIYNKTVGNILSGVYTVIGGAPSSGTSSFVDTNYVMNVLLQWYNSDDRKPLKVFYFTLVDDVFKKMQKFLCSYIKLVDNIRIDVPTLNSQPGKLYDINEREDVLESLNNAKLFFDEIEKEEVFEIVDERRPPSEIFHTVASYLSDIGHDKKGDPYELKDDYANGLVMVVIDSVDALLPEIDGYGRSVRDDLSRRMDAYAYQLADRYKVNVNLIVPTETGYIRQLRDTIPTNNHLGIFGKHCHRGVILYDPVLEGTLKFVMPGDDNEIYVSNGINTLRMWYVVRNTDGADSMTERLLMLPGTSFIIEHSLSKDLVEFSEVYDVLMGTESPYNL